MNQWVVLTGDLFKVKYPESNHAGTLNILHGQSTVCFNHRTLSTLLSSACKNFLAPRLRGKVPLTILSTHWFSYEFNRRRHIKLSRLNSFSEFLYYNVKMNFWEMWVLLRGQLRLGETSSCTDWRVSVSHLCILLLWLPLLYLVKMRLQSHSCLFTAATAKR